MEVVSDKIPRWYLHSFTLSQPPRDRVLEVTRRHTDTDTPHEDNQCDEPSAMVHFHDGKAGYFILDELQKNKNSRHCVFRTRNR